MTGLHRSTSRVRGLDCCDGVRFTAKDKKLIVTTFVRARAKDVIRYTRRNSAVGFEIYLLSFPLQTLEYWLQKTEGSLDEHNRKGA